MTDFKLSSVSTGWARTVGSLWRTGDVGRTWAPIPFPATTGGLVFGYQMDKSGFGWVQSAESVELTTDGGSTWTSSPLPAALTGGRGLLSAAWFISPGGIGWAGGGEYRRADSASLGPSGVMRESPSGAIEVISPVVYRTQNGGRTWSTGTIISDEYRVRSIIFNDPTHGWLLTDKSVYYTVNGGGAWTRSRFPLLGEHDDYRLDIDATPSLLIFPSSANVLLIFSNGAVFSSQDRGRSWVLICRRILDGAAPPEQAVFISDRLGFLKTADGTLFTTRDAGKTWAREDVGGSVFGIAGLPDSKEVKLLLQGRLCSASPLL